jgi:ABC-type antimicrobial peptide transport system permease subunit
MALGAGAAQVRALVVRDVAVMLAIGTAAGVLLAIIAGRFLQTFLYGLKASNLLVYAAAGAVLWAIALAAAYVPARRATAIDSLTALRYE